MQQSNSITLVYYTIGWQESTVPVVTPHICFMNNPNAGKMIRANLRRRPAAPRPKATASPPARQLLAPGWTKIPVHPCGWGWLVRLPRARRGAGPRHTKATLFAALLVASKGRMG